jgi:DNA-binding transcriptional MerR regulator
MNLPTESSATALQLFEPDPDAVYTIEAVEHLAQVPRRMILVCCRHGLISPALDLERGGYSFDDEAIHTLRRIEYLRTVRGINLEGIKMILHLMNEVERIQTEMRFRRG